MDTSALFKTHEKAAYKIWPYIEISEKWTTLFKIVTRGVRLWLAVESSVPYEGYDFDGNHLFLSFKHEAKYMLTDDFYISILTDFVRMHFGSHVTVSCHLKGTLKTTEKIETNESVIENKYVHEAVVEKIKAKSKPLEDVKASMNNLQNTLNQLITISIDNSKLWSIYADNSIWSSFGFENANKMSIRHEGALMVISPALAGDHVNARSLHGTSSKRSSVKFPKASPWNEVFSNINASRNFLASLVNGEIIIDTAQALMPTYHNHQLNDNEATLDVEAKTVSDQLPVNEVNSEALDSKSDEVLVCSANVDSNFPIFTVTKTETKLNIFAEKSVWLEAGYKHLTRLTYQLSEGVISLVPTDKNVFYDNTTKARVSESGEKWSMSFIISGEVDGIPVKDKFKNIISGYYHGQCSNEMLTVNFTQKANKPSRLSRKVKSELTLLSVDAYASKNKEVQDDVAYSMMNPSLDLALVPKESEQSKLDLKVFHVSSMEDSNNVTQLFKSDYKFEDLGQEIKSDALDVVQSLLSAMDPAGLHSKLSGLKSIYSNLCYPHDAAAAMKALFSYRNLMSEEEMLHMNIKNILESRQSLLEVS